MESYYKSIQVKIPLAVWKNLQLLSLTYNIPAMKLYEICIIHALSCNWFLSKLKQKFNDDTDLLLQFGVEIATLPNLPNAEQSQIENGE